MLHLLKKLRRPGLSSRISCVNVDGSALSYSGLLKSSHALASVLRKRNIKEPTIACFHKASSGYVVTMLATWMVGKRFLPLCTTHPEAELRYFVEDSKAGAIVYSSVESCSKHSYNALPNLGVPLLDLSSESTASERSDAFPDPDMNSDALILYTSGTTGRPKGVVHTHNGVTCMISGLVDRWEYSPDDRILHFLPLHHLHGVLNKLMCVLYAGGCVEFLPSAHPQEIWTRLAKLDLPKVNLFMAVPTVYARMIEYAKDALMSISDQQEEYKKSSMHRALNSVKVNMRLMACGSAALPDTVMKTWRELTGHVLLERYGMTEGGMLLSNDYLPVSNRTPGHVGKPLPYVTVRLVGEHENEIPGSNSSPPTNSTVIAGGEDEEEEGEATGELRVKGPTVFKEYLNRPDVYRESFDKDGWFKTGDIAVRRKNGMYAILGRSSTDIIKSKGYKLSALEIERELLAFENVIKEVAVVGRPHLIDGEYVAAVVVVQAPYMHQSHEVLVAQIKSFLKSRLANYKSPKRYFFAKQPLPRNALGKVGKKTLFKDMNINDSE